MGPLEVLLDGTPVAIPAGRARTLLATLLLRAGEVVPVDVLVDRLWDGSPPNPARAKSTLHMVVTRLRRSLGEANCVRTATDGYLADIAPGALDLHRFRSLVDDGRFADALALWRGSPLSNVASDSLHRDEVTALADERLEVLERRIEADLDAGRLPGLVAELHTLTRRHPLRERFWAQLMLALHRSDQQAEALAAYRSVSALLAEELGVDPGPTLRDLNARVLRSDPDLAGYRSVVAPTPRQLPPRSAHFVGRSEEVERLADLLDAVEGDTPVIVSAVNGAGGVGKTALAVFWANRVKDRFPDGQLYVNLRGFDSRREPLAVDDALRGFLGALVADPKSIPNERDARTSLYRSLLANRRVLVVLDNARDAEQVRPLLPGSPSCFTLVTSRSRLEGLIVTEDATLIALDVLADDDSRSLLARRIGAVRVTAEPEAVRRIVLLCGGLPLALSIVAARALMNPRSTLAALADGLSSERGRLDFLETGDLATSVRGVFSWSYKNLAEASAVVFRLLAVHPGASFTVPVVASAAAIPLDAAAKVVADLVRVNLLLNPETDRFHYHDLLRVYAAELVGSVEADARRRLVLKRVLSHYVHSAQAARKMMSPTGIELQESPPDEVVVMAFASRGEAMKWYEEEYGNIISSLRSAMSEQLSEYVGMLQEAIWYYLDSTSRWDQAVALSETVLEFLEDVEDPYRNRPGVLLDLAVSNGRLGRLQESIAYSTAALADARESGNLKWERKSLNNLGMAYSALGRDQEAVEFLHAALEVCAKTEGRVGERILLDTLATVHSKLGEHERAEAYLEEALRINRGVDDSYSAAINLTGLGALYSGMGRWDEACGVLLEALELSRSSGDRYNQAVTLSRLGDVAEGGGDHTGADAYRRRALDVFAELGVPEAHELRAKLVAAPDRA
ncbi:BTAD domain-containing putative transcriptional regulator [Umezawaea sp. Da 62-37]|uniref:AfsR/SARP family transcriptional regulator n=1 Tax=Umezawaea sp. Da 62-37 TaxID=3075927 RepID=UPI0028F6C43E|nr:BTAD domain-containing putative transcriptional regulator [Umezawaea sp. Da 62-37]WNV90855.1 BTAD domain-containing putative transcriptional regulator [Umezawaea sp. Da 62-37]